ncbi:MAG: YbjQ family protein [Stellaceae bacterium]
MEEARRAAVDRLVQNATAMGANAVVMMRFDSSEIGQTMSEIVAYGTAATIEPLNL